MDIKMSRCGAEKAEGAYRLKEPIQACPAAGDPAYTLSSEVFTNNSRREDVLDFLNTFQLQRYLGGPKT